MGEQINSLSRFDHSRDYSKEEELVCRKKFFENYKLKQDEILTENSELICSKCRNKRYFQKNDFVVICNCKCQTEAIKRAEEERKAKERMRSLERLKEMSLLGKKYKDANFENLDLNRPQDFLKAVERCKKYCEKWSEVQKRGLGIYLYGDVGTGKSLLTACIGNYLLSKFVTVLFTNFFEIAKQIKKTFSDY